MILSKSDIDVLNSLAKRKGSESWIRTSGRYNSKWICNICGLHIEKFNLPDLDDGPLWIGMNAKQLNIHGSMHLKESGLVSFI